MNRKVTLLLTLLFLGFFSKVDAQCPANLDFELGTYANWLYYTGTFTGGAISTPTLSGPVAGRHTLTSGPGIDAFGLFPVVAPGGGSYSLKLGSTATLYLAERATYNVHVPATPGIYSLVYHYAVVLENPAGHSALIQPHMTVTAYDSATNATVPCTSYTYVSSPTVPGFLLSALPGTGGAGSVYYKPWTLGNMKFPGLGGHTVTVDFAVADCGAGGHFGYCYIDMSCGFFANSLITCASGSTVLSGPDGYSGYLWKDSATFSTTYGASEIITITSPTVTTTYAVILTPYTGYGCPDTLYTRVIPSSLTLHMGADTAICSGNSVTLRSGATSLSMPLTYSWSPVSTLSCSTCANPVATPTTTTTYSVTVTDGAGCIKYGTTTVTVVPTPCAIVGPAIVCPTFTITETDCASGGVWTSAPATVATIGISSGVLTGVATAGGVATVLYTTGGICTVSRTVTVMPAPAAILPASPHVCVGANITLTDATPGGIWSDVCCTAYATVGSGSGIVTGVLSPGTATITYTAPSGCTATKTVTIDLPSTITGYNMLCLGGTTTAYPTIPGGTWTTTSSTITVGSTSGIILGTSVGPGVVTYTLSSGCTTIWAVTVNPVPAPVTGRTHICVGSADTMSDVTSGGIWSATTSGVVLDIDPATGYITTYTTGIDTILYTVTYPSGASCSASVIDTVLALPTVTGITSLCVNTSTTLSSTGTVTWSSSNTAIATVGASSGVVFGVSSGSVNITCMSAAGCITVTPVLVYPLPLPISGPTNVCVLSSISLTDGTTPGFFSTAPGTWATVTPTGTVTGVAVGMELITYTESAHGCSRTLLVTVNNTPGPITGILALCPGSSTTLSNIVPGGTWSSTTPAVGTIGSTSGVVTGIGTGTSIITYSLGASCYSTAVLTVNPAPPAIAPASPTVCVGSTLTLTDAATPGTWSSACPSILTVGAGSGIVSGISTGACSVTFTNTATGCSTSKIVTVNPNPLPISPSAPNVCQGQTITMTDPSGGGTWSSTIPTIGSIVPLTGVLTGVNPGTTTIKYTLPTTCFTSVVATVNPLPTLFFVTGGGAFCAGGAGMNVGLSGSQIGVGYQLYVGGVAIGGSIPGTGSAISFGAQSTAGIYTVVATNPVTGCTRTMTGSVTVTVNPLPPPIVGPSALCVGASIILTDGAGPGGWVSSNTLAATCGAGPSSTTTLVGITTGLSTTITYTIPATGCYTTHSVTVSPSPTPITGLSSVCVAACISLFDSVLGGSWSASNAKATVTPFTGSVCGVTAGIDTITYSLGTGCTMTKIITITAAPMPITGVHTMCQGDCDTFHDATIGGSWLLDPLSVGLGTIGAGTGIFCGTASGVAMLSYAASGGTGCAVQYPVTINVIPAAISGSAQVCQGSTTPLATTTPGGTWSITPTTYALIGATTGVLSGVLAGSPSTVKYTAGGCSTTILVTVNPLPAVITGTSHVCQGSTVILTSSPATGTWSTTSGFFTVTPGPATSTVVTGGSVGVGTVVYTLPTGCLRSTLVTVNLTPANIIGPASVCVGHTAILSDATPAGTWSSSNTAVATIGPGTGIVTGVTAGIVTITYTIGSCIATTSFSVVAPPMAIVGSAAVCVGSCTTFTDPTLGGTWSSSMPSYATVNSTSGVVCGIASGTVIISYGAGSGCQAVLPIVVNPVAPILGPLTVCEGQDINLTDTALGGTWLSSSTSIATVTGGGVVHGVAGGTVTIDYLLPTTCMASVVVTVNPMPAAITGTTHGCVGQHVPLSTTSTLGTWTSSNTFVATVDASGIVTCNNPGITTISYSYSSTTGCATTMLFTVNANPPAIGGPNVVCLHYTITLTDAGVGTWSSSLSTTAGVGSSDGIVIGNALGSATISFTATSTGCPALHPVTVINSPLAIVGDSSVCQGSYTLYTDPSGSGSWSSSPFPVGSIDATTGMFFASTPGVATITFSMGAGCNATKTVTVNTLPCPIAGSANLCVGSSGHYTDCIPGGAWSSSDPTVGTIDPLSGVLTGIGPGVTIITDLLPTGCSTTMLVTVSNGPAPITGSNTICLGTCTTLSDATFGGSWSGTCSVASVNPSGVVCGLSLGSAIISYTVAGSVCPATFTISVNPLPLPITGPTQVCQGAAITMSDGVPGGTWSSNLPGIGSVDPATGVVTGIVTGIAVPVPVTIRYTLGAGCDTFIDIIVNPLPSPITGPNTVCQGQSIVLVDPTGGTWSSGMPAIGSVDAVGDVTGLSDGVAVISYTNSYLCSVIHPVTVNVAPAPITGSTNVCLGGTSALHDAVSGGTWWSVVPAIGSIDAVTGVVRGMSLGTTTIGYILPGGCFVTTNISVYPLPTVYTVTGGGSHCASDTGVAIGLTGSAIGVNYMVYHGATAVGTFAGTGGPLSCGLFTLSGTYTIAGTSTITGCSVNMAGTAVINIIPNVTPVVTLAASPGTTVCAGTTVTFTSTIVNGGSSPSLVWKINSTPVALTPAYSFIPANGDTVKLTLTSNATCATPVTVSRYLVMTVNPFGHPSVDLAIEPNDTVCEGTLVSVNALPAFGGTSPVYSWVKNNYPMTATGTPFSFVPNNGDVVYCIMNSNYICRLENADTSIPLKITVDAAVLPIVTINAYPGTIIGPGQKDSLVASATNAVLPTYQWFVNGIPVPGSTTNKFVSASFSSPKEDSVSCMVTSHGVCTIAAHQWVYIQVSSVGVKPVTLGGSDINVLPNPNKGEFMVKGTIGTISYEDVALEITDILGQVVYHNNVVAKGGKLNELIKLNSNIANGMYVLSLRSAGENRVFHIVIEQ